MEVVKKGKIKFYPKRWTKVYLNWMENIQDWCISRQIWWGHRLPVYYCKSCQKQGLSPQIQEQLKNKGTVPNTESIIVSKTKPEKCPVCNSTDIYQDEDVLDTWFSSWLWPFATFGWPGQGLSPSASEGTVPKEDLAYFYPTSVLVTAPEIIFFWVARMIMAGLEFMQDIPFNDVYIHGTVRDIEGKKMSKSLGNIIDPIEVINEYGADALRFSIISITAQGQDVFLSEERFQQGRNFANKIWNAARFIITNLEEGLSPSASEGTVPLMTLPARTDLCEFFKKGDLDIVNRWILSRFYSVLKEVNKLLDAYKLNEAANILYGFFWHEFCDWYLEIIKPNIKDTKNQLIMYKVLEKSLRVLHPFMPFVTEDIWQKLEGQSPRVGSGTVPTNSIMVQPWPHIQEQMMDKRLEREAQSIFEAIRQIRNLRTSIEIKPEQKVRVSVYPHAKTKQKLIRENAGLIKNLAKLEVLEILDSPNRPSATISAISRDLDIYLHFSGLLDIHKEQRKIKEKIDALNKIHKSKAERIKNKEFLAKAPIDVVKKEKEGIKELADSIKRLERMYNELL